MLHCPTVLMSINIYVCVCVRVAAVEWVWPGLTLRSSRRPICANPTSSTSCWLCTTGRGSPWRSRGRRSWDLWRKKRQVVFNQNRAEPEPRRPKSLSDHIQHFQQKGQKRSVAYNNSFIFLLPLYFVF